MSTASSSKPQSYNLKWDSHSTHMNLSLATLYKHDRFADVMLLSSHPDCLEGPGVPAHKIILSASSKFFANVFELTPHIPSQNGLMYLVLPPSLSRRAIQILVQYMYSGESTVSNDILSEVLNGGELLKIRGLYRGNISDLNKNLNFTSPVMNANLSSNSNHTITQSSSPSLNLKTAEKIISHQKQSSKVVQHTKSLPTVLPDKKLNLSVKKNIAIDPDYKKSLTSSPTCCSIQRTISNRYSEKPLIVSVVTLSNSSLQNPIQRRKSSIESNYSDCLLQVKEEPNDSCSEKSQSISNFNEIEGSESKIEEAEYQGTKTCFIKGTSKHKIAFENSDTVLKNFLISDQEDNSFSLVSDDSEDKVKFSIQNDSDSEVKQKQKSVNFLPKKRKLEVEPILDIKKPISSKNNQIKRKEILGLKCDICVMECKSPADWVRHTKLYHTESELAIVNEKYDN